MEATRMIEKKHQALIYSWIQETVWKVTENRPAPIHLDELFGCEKEPDDWIPIGIECFLVMRQRLQQLGNPVQGRLDIGLVERPMGTLQEGLVPLTMDDFRAQLSSLSPPELYLIHWNLAKEFITGTFFRSRLPFQVLAEEPAGVTIQYCEYRIPTLLNDQSTCDGTSFELERFVTLYCLPGS